MEQFTPPELLTIREVAEKLRCSRVHVANVLGGRVPNLPHLPHIQIGRRKLILRSSLVAWMVAAETKEGQR